MKSVTERKELETVTIDEGDVINQNSVARENKRF